MRGAVWTVLASITSRVVGLVGTVLITRFLDPDEYGQVSLAAVVIMTANLFSNCGLSQYIVSRPHASERATFHATFFFTLLGVVALAAAVILGGPFGYLIHAEGIARFLPGLAFAALLERVGTIQDRIQVRDMRFGSVALQRALGECTFSATAVGLAAFGKGTVVGSGNAIVLASIARSAIRLLSLSLSTDRRAWLSPCAITRKETRELFQFGLPMAIATFASFASRRWDNFLYAALFGQAAAGIYNLAYNLADIPASQLADTLGDVLVPSFAALPNGEQRRAALMLAQRQMTLLVSPLSVGLGAVAPTLVQTFLDRRWAGVAPALAILSGLSVVRPIAWIGSSYLQVKNRPRIIMVVETLKTVGLLGLMALAGKYGPLVFGVGSGESWACASIGVAFAFGSLAYMAIFQRIDGLSLGSQLRAVAPPVVACVPMGAAVVTVHRAIGYGFPAWVRLAIEVFVGAAVFVPSALLLARNASKEFLALVMGRFQEPKPPDPQPSPPRSEASPEGTE